MQRGSSELVCSIFISNPSISLTHFSRRDGTPFINLLMCAPLYDDRGTIRYFIGAQIDVTGLIEHGMGIESFRALLQKDQQQQDNEGIDRASSQTPKHGDTRHSKNVKETLDRLQELSNMFSQDESDVVKNNSRCDDSTDAGSIRSVVPTSVKNRGQARRIIGAEELPGDGLNLSQLSFNNNPNAGHSLPGAYQHASSFCICLLIMLTKFSICWLDQTPPSK